MYSGANRVSLHAIRRVSGEGCGGMVGGWGGGGVKRIRHDVMFSLRFGTVGATHATSQAACHGQYGAHVAGGGCYE